MPSFLDRHYAAKTVDEIRSVYDEWAPTYENELEAENYRGAESVASIVAQAVRSKDACILDVGCGTGLVGVHLAAEGFSQLHGIDLSRGMLAQADVKRCYRRLECVDLLKPLTIPSRSYDAVVSAGLFTLSLLGPEVLRNVCELARPGGRAIIGINTEAYDTQDYARTLDEVIRSRDGEIAMIRDMPYWPDKNVSTRVVVLQI